MAYPENLLDSDYVLDKYGKDRDAARWQFIEFNENANDDQFLDNDDNVRKRDYRMRKPGREIVKFIGERNITQVKDYPRRSGPDFAEGKGDPRVGQRQAARILGIPSSLIFKA